MSNDTRSRPMTAETIHTCSYYCERPECVRRQRDELRDRMEAVLAKQPPVEGEEIMVNAGHDVFILPLQPSGLSSGPRFVVHVPAPEQPEAVDEAKETDLWRCTVCGRVGTVGRCCGEETRERANMESLLAEIEERREEVEGLRADLMESDEIREKLGHLLTRTAAALKGEPPAGGWNSWHDLPERAALAVRRAERLAEALRELVEVFSESGMYDEEVFAKARAALAQEQEAGRG